LKKSGSYQRTTRYNIDKLVWFEQGDSIESAIAREKQLKAWKRAWKIDLIEQANPHRNDLYATIV
jgi:putative endonuclease